MMLFFEFHLVSSICRKLKDEVVKLNSTVIGVAFKLHNDNSAVI